MSLKLYVSDTKCAVHDSRHSAFDLAKWTVDIVKCVVDIFKCGTSEPPNKWPRTVWTAFVYVILKNQDAFKRRMTLLDLHVRPNWKSCNIPEERAMKAIHRPNSSWRFEMVQYRPAEEKLFANFLWRGLSTLEHIRLPNGNFRSVAFLLCLVDVIMTVFELC